MAGIRNARQGIATDQGRFKVMGGGCGAPSLQTVLQELVGLQFVLMKMYWAKDGQQHIQFWSQTKKNKFSPTYPTKWP